MLYYLILIYAIAVVKILSLSTSEHNGGAAIVAYNLTSYMRKYGHDVSLLSQDSLVNSCKLPYAKRLLRASYKFKRLISRVIGYIDDDKSPIYSSYSVIPSGISSLVNHIEPDLLHLHWIQGELISLEQLSSINLPIVWTLHDAWPITQNSKHHILSSALEPQTINTAPNGLLSRIMAWRKMNVIKHSNITFVAPSEWMYTLVKTSNISTNLNVRIIPNGLDLDVFRPLPSSQRYYYLESNHVNDKHLVLLISSLASVSDPVKGFDLFLAAIRLLQDWGHLITLVVMGSSSNIHLPDIKIVRIGCVHDPQELVKVYNSVDVTCLPSRIETHSQTACESIACGTPVAAFNAAGNSSVISEGLTGYLAESYDARSFARAIIKCRGLSRSELSRSDLSKNAQKWDLASVSEAHISLYQEILSMQA